MDNIFIRFGQWLAKKPLDNRVAALEAALLTHKAQIDVLTSLNKQINEQLVKLEMHVGFRRVGKSKEDIRTLLDAWEGIVQ